MPSIDRSGRAHATRQQVRVIYSQHKIEEQALNQGTSKRMNSSGASSGASTIFYAAGAASGTGEELAAVLLANSTAPTPPTAPRSFCTILSTQSRHSIYSFMGSSFRRISSNLIYNNGKSWGYCSDF